jgi:hypothetical protein
VEQLASTNSETWCRWVDQRIGEHLDLYHDALMKALGDVVATERDGRDKNEVSAAVEEVKRWVEGKLEAKLGPLEGRVAQHLAQYSGRADAIGDAIAAERAERQKEIKTAVDEIKRAVEAKLEALEKHIERYTEQAIIGSQFPPDVPKHSPGR